MSKASDFDKLTDRELVTPLERHRFDDDAGIEMRHVVGREHSAASRGHVVDAAQVETKSEHPEQRDRDPDDRPVDPLTSTHGCPLFREPHRPVTRCSEVRRRRR